MREPYNLTTFMCQMSWKCGSLNLLEPFGPHRDCYGTSLTLPLIFIIFVLYLSLCWLCNRYLCCLAFTHWNALDCFFFPFWEQLFHCLKIRWNYANVRFYSLSLHVKAEVLLLNGSRQLPSKSLLFEHHLV